MHILEPAVVTRVTESHHHLGALAGVTGSCPALPLLAPGEQTADGCSFSLPVSQIKT